MTVNELKATLKGEQTVGDTLKTIGGMVVNYGSDIAVATALTALTAGTKKKGFKKAALGVGIFVLSMKIGEEAETYFYKVVDDLKETFKTAKKEVAEALEEADEEDDENEEEQE